MDNLSIPMSLLPKWIIHPVAFIADKNPELPDYGVNTGDIVIVDSGIEFVDGELSVLRNEKTSGYRLSKEKLPNHRHFGKVVMVLRYYGNRVFI